MMCVIIGRLLHCAEERKRGFSQNKYFCDIPDAAAADKRLFERP